MPSGAKKRKAAKKKDHGGAYAPDSPTNPLPSPTHSHESDGEEAPPTPKSQDGHPLTVEEGEGKKKEASLTLTVMEASSGNGNQGVEEPQWIDDSKQEKEKLKGDPSGLKAAKAPENGGQDAEEPDTHGQVDVTVEDAVIEPEVMDVIVQVEEVPSPPSPLLPSSAGAEVVSVEFVNKPVESVVGFVTEDAVQEGESRMNAPIIQSEERVISPPDAAELSTDSRKPKIPLTIEVSRDLLAQQRSSLCSCCGLLDVIMGSRR